MSMIIGVLLMLCTLTCMIEVIPFLFLKNRKKWIKTSVLCNIITNPIVNIFMMIISVFDISQAFYWLVLVALEIAVVIFETCIYYNVLEESASKCRVMTVVANASSFLAGIFVLDPLFAMLHQRQ